MAPSLRRLLRERPTVWAAGAYDALSARIIEHSGFDAVFTSGYGITAAHLGMPDMELWTMTEALTVNTNICAATSVPVMADVDTAFGGPANAQRTMRAFERAGVAAVVVEDQLLPKRCPLGVPAGIQLMDANGAAKKIEAMLDVRTNADLLLIARTDAPTLDETIRRARMYLAAGADIAQPTSRGVRTFDDLRRLRDAIGAKLSVQVLGWLESLIPEQVEEVAVLATFGVAPVLTGAQALLENMSTLARTHCVGGLPRPMATAAAFGQFIGFAEIDAINERYASGPEHAAVM